MPVSFISCIFKTFVTYETRKKLISICCRTKYLICLSNSWGKNLQLPLNKLWPASLPFPQYGFININIGQQKGTHTTLLAGDQSMSLNLLISRQRLTRDMFSQHAGADLLKRRPVNMSHLAQCDCV